MPITFIVCFRSKVPLCQSPSSCVAEAKCRWAIHIHRFFAEALHAAEPLTNIMCCRSKVRGPSPPQLWPTWPLPLKPSTQICRCCDKRCVLSISSLFCTPMLCIQYCILSVLLQRCQYCIRVLLVYWVLLVNIVYWVLSILYAECVTLTL